jgi:hypothetical protein
MHTDTKILTGRERTTQRQAARHGPQRDIHRPGNIEVEVEGEGERERERDGDSSTMRGTHGGKL